VGLGFIVEDIVIYILDMGKGFPDRFDSFSGVIEFGESL
jgi:hypothetical protein